MGCDVASPQDIRLAQYQVQLRTQQVRDLVTVQLRASHVCAAMSLQHMQARGRRHQSMEETNLNPANDLMLDPETPEDVAVLYTWANVHGGKYRDFSASRREFRAAQRHRAVEAQRQAALVAAREREQAAQREMEEARRLEQAVAANEIEPSTADEVRRRAEERAERDRSEATRLIAEAEDLKRALEAAQREMEEARARANEQAARYAEADARWRAQKDTRGEIVPGEIVDPYCFAGHLDPLNFAPTKGVRTSQAARVSSESRIASSYYRAREESGLRDEAWRPSRDGRASSGARTAYRPVATHVPAPVDTILEYRERHQPIEQARLLTDRDPQEIEDSNRYYDGEPADGTARSLRTYSDQATAPADLHVAPRSQDMDFRRADLQRPRIEDTQDGYGSETSRRRREPAADAAARTTRQPRYIERQGAADDRAGEYFAAMDERDRLDADGRAADLRREEERRDDARREELRRKDERREEHRRAELRRADARRDDERRAEMRQEEERLEQARAAEPETRSEDLRRAEANRIDARLQSDAERSSLSGKDDASGAAGPEWLARERHTPRTSAGERTSADERNSISNENEAIYSGDSPPPRYVAKGRFDDGGPPSRSRDRMTAETSTARRERPSGRSRANMRGAQEATPKSTDGGFNLPPMRDRPDSAGPAPLADQAASQNRPPQNDASPAAAPIRRRPTERELYVAPPRDTERPLREAFDTQVVRVAQHDPLPPIQDAAEPVRSDWMRDRANEAASYREGPVPAPRPPAPKPQPASVRAQLPADTLQQSRERVASRWFALKGLVVSQSEPQPEVPVPAPRQGELKTPVLAVVSLSGGVGKTSLVATLGRALSSEGEKVLLADTASHGMLPYYFGARELRPDVVRTFSPPPGSANAPVYMVNYETDRLAGDEAGQTELIEEITRHARGTQRVLLDLNSSSAWLARRMARYSSNTLVPIAPDMNSVLSIQAMERFFSGAVDRDGRSVEPYYVLNQFDASLPLHLDVREVLRQQLGSRLLSVMIRRSPTVAEALAEGMTVMDYAPESPVTEDYANLAAWVRNLAAPAVTGLRSIRWSER